MTTNPTKFTDRAGDSIEVTPSGIQTYAQTRIGEVGVSSFRSVFLDPEEAQRLALAILTGPGKVEIDGHGRDPKSRVEQAASALRAHFRELDTEREREADQKKLDEEALALLNAHRRRIGGSEHDSLNAFNAPTWRALARAAREIHADRKES